MLVGGLFGGAAVRAEDPPAAPAAAGSPRGGVAVLRHWKIQKGTYEKFRRISERYVWPRYEKAGARIVGMWQVAHPDSSGQPGEAAGPVYDEVYLLTEYDDLEHWKATRYDELAESSETGLEALALRTALRARRKLVVSGGADGEVTFLQSSERGAPAPADDAAASRQP